MKSQKVAHLSSVHPPFDSRIFDKECLSLSKAGYEVVILVPHERDETVDGIQIISVPKPAGRIHRMTRTLWQMLAVAQRINADVYHFHDPELMIIGFLLHRKNRRVVYDIHEDLPRDILTKHYLPAGCRAGLSWLSERIENFLCKFFSALVTSTPAIEARFNGINDLTVSIQNFPVLGEFNFSDQKPWKDRALSIVYVGALSENRGIRQMLEAVHLLSPSFDIKFQLAGKFSPPSLRDEVSRLPGWAHVIEHGYTSHRSVVQLLGSARVGLVALHPEHTFKVSYPVKLFEYMAAGIPVVASDFPLWREIVEEAGCGLVVDPLDSIAIADALSYLLNNPEESESMGHRGRLAVEKRYNWGPEEQKLLDLYGRLLA